MAKPIPTRAGLLELIAQAALRGNLGLFLGSGFSKGVLEYRIPTTALDWAELLRAVCVELKITYDLQSTLGASFPDIASSICEHYAKISTPTILLQEARLRFKEAVARLTTWYPSKDQRDHFGRILNKIAPQWIITTNYDLVIEALLQGRGVSIPPTEVLPLMIGTVPVYHLHGVKHDPKSIVITREDYIELFRPNEYRQSKLATAIKEATTVFLGYALGDINVLTAIDWSRNVYSGTLANSEFIQVLYMSSPKGEPYRNEADILVIEMDDLAGFMQDLEAVYQTSKTAHDTLLASLSSSAGVLDACDPRNVTAFIDNAATRKNVLGTLARYPAQLIGSFMTFFSACLDDTWKRAQVPGAFDAYDKQLVLILDVLMIFDFAKLPPALFEMLAVSFERLGTYIGTNAGESWAAHSTWESRKGDIPKATIAEIKQHGQRRGFSTTRNLVAGL